MSRLAGRRALTLPAARRTNAPIEGTMTAAGGNGGVSAAILSLLLCGVCGADLLAGEPGVTRRGAPLDGSDVGEVGAPDPPELVGPIDGATGVTRNPEFRVRVVDPDHHALDVTFYARPRVARAAPFTFIHWSDTQHYAESHPDIFETMTSWIHESVAERNIVFAPMSGDLVDNADQPIQWARADVAVRLLEPALAGFPDGLPFGVLPGNHDQFPRDQVDSTEAYNQTFGVSRFVGRSYYGGSFNGTDNDYNFVLFDVEGMGFISIFIGFDLDPDPRVLAWADSLLTAHADRRAVVVSHYLIDVGEQAPFGVQGQAIYHALKHHPNLFLMLCGDAHGEGRRVDVDEDRVIHTLLANYQDRDEGGQGWLRILEFRPAENEIRVSTYSPWLDEFETDADSEFTLHYQLTPWNAFTELGTVHGVGDGADAVWSWPEREPYTAYEWYVKVTDGCREAWSPIWSFTTEREVRFSAYNDLAWRIGQPTGGITRITSPNGGSSLPSAGTLVDHSTGAPVPITLTVNGGVFDGDAHGQTGGEPPDPSDAYTIFGDRVSSVGQVSYIDDAQETLTLAFAGAEPGSIYELAFHAHRDDFGWDQASRVTLSGQLAFANRSSVGLDDRGDPLFSGPDDPSTRLPADNDAGWVARFTDIDVGADGEITLTVDWDGSPGSEYRGKYASAVFLREYVGPGNRLPIVADPGDRSDAELDTVSVAIAADDPDGDDLVFGAAGLPPGLVIDAHTGHITGVLAPGSATESPYVVDVAANDGHGPLGWTGFIWRVGSESRRATAPSVDFVHRPAVPNPFRPATRIRFRVGTATPVSIRIYDVGGRLARHLFDDGVSAGEHEIVWDGRTDAGAAVGSGIYFYGIDAGGRRVASERLIRVR